jgi:hypothetical protein
MSSTYQNKKTSLYKCGSANASLQSCSTERVHLQEVLKMSFMRRNTYLGTSYYGLSNPLKDLKIVFDSLADVNSVLVKCPCIVNRKMNTEGLQVLSQVKIQIIQIK